MKIFGFNVKIFHHCIAFDQWIYKMIHIAYNRICKAGALVWINSFQNFHFSCRNETPLQIQQAVKWEFDPDSWNGFVWKEFSVVMEWNYSMNSTGLLNGNFVVLFCENVLFF